MFEAWFSRWFRLSREIIALLAGCFKLFRAGSPCWSMGWQRGDWSPNALFYDGFPGHSVLLSRDPGKHGLACSPRSFFHISSEFSVQ
jgi:hypothetical protein